MDRHRRWMFVWLAASVAAAASAAVLMLAGVASAGVDGDGNLDVVFANGFSGGEQPNRACLGDGSVGFVCSDAGADSATSSDVALGDVDGDGELDAVFANFAGQRNRVCLGDGPGGFVCSDVSTDNNNSGDVALGDVDGDGHLDAVFANFDGRNRACLGDGSGGFVCGDVSADTNTTWGVALGDVDGDGHLDAVFANFDFQRNRVCLGDGSGSFVCSDVSTDTNRSQDVALGDVDGDGNLDAVFPNGGEGIEQRNRVCLGDGSGGFSCGDVSTDCTASGDVALGDVDRDGHLDAVFANILSQRNKVCLGDGAGRFSCTDVSADDNFTWDVAIAPGHRGRFSDDDFNIFEDDIEWMADQGITLGCNPEGTLYCPLNGVTRAQMASFLARALDLPPVAGNRFTDVSGTHTANINALAEAGVTLGCNPEGTLYCPNDQVTRAQMGSFLARALMLAPIPGDRFSDVSGTHEPNINAIAEAGITLGCNPEGTLYCPNENVTRGQMAAFLHRALG